MTVLDRFSTMYADICQITLDDLADIYASNVAFVDPITTHHGLNSVQKYFANLLGQAERCQFDISMIAPVNSNSITHIVNWTMNLKLKQSDKLIVVDGNTQLTVKDDKIVYHKDYYDLGEMVYEHIPLLGFFVKKIKKRLAK
ncbi:conserved hypothetical protein [Alteromonas sp. 38]|uniref:nuclear transport factor 2 family protein n=1 Tax=Alteromonas TaxID=226 RepID=UPI0012F0BEE1|nr:MULTISPECIES: nuclear transport factor 2 family protein [Alteromonas]CAD5266544.1 conserved hypothetical protein [Alteromonas sp. 154]VXC05438.1 conserved hypothetical protein [Alteromonas sp. 38]